MYVKLFFKITIDTLDNMRYTLNVTLDALWCRQTFKAEGRETWHRKRQQRKVPSQQWIARTLLAHSPEPIANAAEA
jgi:hypothetical protein